jgi:hypothetical protein
MNNGSGKELLPSLAELAESVRKLIAPFSDPVLKELGEYVAGKIRFINFRNSLKVLEQAKCRLDALGMRPNSVNLKILVPILDGAGLEDNDDLIEMWSGLLASAAGNCKVLPSFAHILTELSPIEAKILDYIHTYRQEIEYGNLGVDKQQLEKAIGLNIEEYGILILNLRRLELIFEITTDGMMWQVGHGDWGAGGHIGLTALGESLINACKGPRRKNEV